MWQLDSALGALDLNPYPTEGSDAYALRPRSAADGTALQPDPTGRACTNPQRLRVHEGERMNPGTHRSQHKENAIRQRCVCAATCNSCNDC